MTRTQRSPRARGLFRLGWRALWLRKAAIALTLALSVGLAGTPGALELAPPPTGATGCLEASTPVALLICSDATLVRLAAAVGETFAERLARAGGEARAALALGQEQWLSQRLDRCQVPATGPALSLARRWQAAPCLADLYRERLTALGAQLNPTPASPTPANPTPASPTPANPTPANPTPASPTPASPTPAEPARPPGFIHPLCLDAILGGLASEAEAEEEAVPLAECTRGNRHIPVVEAGDGSVTAEAAVAGVPTAVRYRRIGRLADGRELLDVAASAGDAGSFSAVVEVRIDPHGRQAPLLRARAIVDGGDRCDGGIAAVRLIDPRALEIDFNATAAAFLAVADEDFPEDLYAEELIPCAECCFGTVRFRHDLASGERTLLSGRLDQKAWDGVATSDTGAAVLDCVRTAVAHIAPKLPHVFTVEEMRKLSQNVQQACPFGPGR